MSIDFSNEPELRAQCYDLLKKVDFTFYRMLESPSISLYSKTRLRVAFDKFKTSATQIIVKKYQEGFTASKFRKAYKNSQILSILKDIFVDLNKSDEGNPNLSAVGELPPEDRMVVRAFITDCENFLFYFERLYADYYREMNRSILDIVKNSIQKYLM